MSQHLNEAITLDNIQSGAGAVRKTQVYFGEHCIAVPFVQQHSKLINCLSEECSTFTLDGQQPTSNGKGSNPMVSLAVHSTLEPAVLYWLFCVLEGEPCGVPSAAWEFNQIGLAVAYLALDKQGILVVLQWCSNWWFMDKNIRHWCILHSTVCNLSSQASDLALIHSTLPISFEKVQRLLGRPVVSLQGSPEEQRAYVAALAHTASYWGDAVEIVLDPRVGIVLQQMIGNRILWQALEEANVAITGRAVYSSAKAVVEKQSPCPDVVHVNVWSEADLNFLIRTALRARYKVGFNRNYNAFYAETSHHRLKFSLSPTSTREGLLLQIDDPALRLYWTPGGRGGASVGALCSVYTVSPAPLQEDPTSNTNFFLSPSFLALELPIPKLQPVVMSGLTTPWLKVAVCYQRGSELEIGLVYREFGGSMRSELELLVRKSLLYVRVPDHLHEYTVVTTSHFVKVTLLPKGISTVGHRIVPLKCFAVCTFSVLSI